MNTILSNLPQENLHISTGVKSVRNIKRDGLRPQVVLRTENGDETTYDHVILACHSDTALEILRNGGITQEEDRILSQFRWSRNEAILHCDETLMPKSRLAWSCWNYLSFTKAIPLRTGQGENGCSTDTSSSEDLYNEKGKGPERLIVPVNQVSLTYNMNDVQHIPERKYGPVLVTLNPPFEPAEDKIRGRWKYDHPVLDSKGIRAQNEMYKIQNTRSISYAGAYLKYGFHEDGFTSGLLAACSIDDDEGGFPSFAFTSALTGMTIPTHKLTVHPPFEIEHADHHIWLTSRRSDNIGHALIARIFDYLELSGVRGLVGTVGVIFLVILQGLLGIQEL